MSLQVTTRRRRRQTTACRPDRPHRRPGTRCNRPRRPPGCHRSGTTETACGPGCRPGGPAGCDPDASEVLAQKGPGPQAPDHRHPHRGPHEVCGSPTAIAAVTRRPSGVAAAASLALHYVGADGAADRGERSHSSHADRRPIRHVLRDLYESFNLEVRYQPDDHAVTIRVTVREDRLPSIHAALDGATGPANRHGPTVKLSNTGPPRWTARMFVAPPTESHKQGNGHEVLLRGQQSALRATAKSYSRHTGRSLRRARATIPAWSPAARRTGSAKAHKAPVLAC